MRRTIDSSLAAKLLVIWRLMVSLPGVAWAQDGQDGQAVEGGAAFAGGQMVRGTVTAVSGGPSDGEDGCGRGLPGGVVREYPAD